MTRERLHNVLVRYHSEINQKSFAIAGPRKYFASKEQLFIWSNNLSSFPPPLVSFRSPRLVLGGHEIANSFLRKIFVRRVIYEESFAVIVVGCHREQAGSGCLLGEDAFAINLAS